MARRYEGELALIGVGSLDSASKIEAFVEKYELSAMPHAIDEDGSLRSKLGVVGQPHWLFVAADGTAEKVFGEIDDDELTARLDRLVDG